MLTFKMQFKLVHTSDSASLSEEEVGEAPKDRLKLAGGAVA